MSLTLSNAECTVTSFRKKLINCFTFFCRYGDRSPRSFFARAFSFVWIMIGLVIISIFTATVTTSLTAISLSNEIKLYGSDVSYDVMLYRSASKPQTLQCFNHHSCWTKLYQVVALKNTEEQRFGVRNNAKVGGRNNEKRIVVVNDAFERKFSVNL